MKTFTVTISGTYQVSAHVVKFEPTGKFETVLNDSRKWFQFWKPKYVTREVLRKVFVREGTKLVRLNKGESIDMDALRLGTGL